MPRCDYDVIFYKVFCITLLAIALTFTVILTNVFIDIDGLLNNEERAKSHESPPNSEVPGVQVPEEGSQNAKFELLYNFNKQLQFEDDRGVDRDKRSTENKQTKYKIKNQKLKRLLSRQLATLLEEIDAEVDDVTKKPEHGPILPPLPLASLALPAINVHVAPKKLFEEEYGDKDKEDAMMHMAIHHLLLSGITSHVDLHEVYRAIHELKEIFKSNVDGKEKVDKHDWLPTSEIPTMQVNEEIKLLDEFENCKEFQQQIANLGGNGASNESSTEGKIIINTLIDIQKDEKHKNKVGPENVKGIVKVLYNGKPVVIFPPQAEVTTKVTESPKPTETTTMPTTLTTKQPIANQQPLKISFGIDKYLTAKTPEYYLKKALADYANKYYKTAINKMSNMNELLNKPRPKRQAADSFKKNNTKKPQDELYVEIETHIDNRDLKNDKRKNRLIKNLIDKIQDAIYSNIGSLSKGNKSFKHQQVKKRFLNPVDDKIIDKNPPIEAVVHRRLDPINKIMNHEDTNPKSVPQFHENDKEIPPGFLSEKNTITSAENGQVHVNYEKSFTEVPHRLQIPLYKDENEYLQDIEKVKLSVKDIDGTGVSIGFNHYVDANPENEKNVFDNLSRLMDTFPESFDEMDKMNSSQRKTNSFNRQLLKTMINLHDIAKREIKLQRIGENFDEQHKEIHPRPLKHSGNSLDYGFSLRDFLNLKQKDKKVTKEFGLNAFDRLKRNGPRVRKIWNVQNQIKLSKNLNTDIMASKPLLWRKNRRVKRDVNNILLTDPNIPVFSDPEIVLPSPYDHPQDIYEASNEHLPQYDDGPPRTVETYIGRNDPETFNFFSPAPLIPGSMKDDTENNPLMSKYPHIFMDRFGKSQEIDLETKLSLMAEQRERPHIRPPMPIGQIGPTRDEQMPGLEDLVKAIAPKTSYKITVKLAPKNHSQLGTEPKNADTRSIEKDFFDAWREERHDEIEERSKRTEAELEGLLLKQKETIKSLFNNRQSENKGKDLIELLLPFDPPKILHLNKEDVSKLLQTALQKLHDLNPSVDDKRTEPTTTTTTVQTTSQSALRSGAAHAEPAISLNDLKSITNEILNKIEKNTNYFQTFLNKLTEKLDSTHSKEPPKTPLMRHLGASTNVNYNTKVNNLKDFSPSKFEQGPQKISSGPPFDVNKNGTFIPFIYAYQHAIPTMNGSRSSDNLANVVYHGHIHANTISNNRHKYEKWPTKIVQDNKRNNTRYFLDQIERSILPVKLFRLMKKPKTNDPPVNNQK